MSGFYTPAEGEINPGKTQMRIAYILSPEDMKLVPILGLRVKEIVEKAMVCLTICSKAFETLISKQNLSLIVT